MVLQNNLVPTGSIDFKLIGFSNFVRTKPRSDRFKVNRFHHIEFWCDDAMNTARHFSWGLGMPIFAKSDLSTGNSIHASYLLRSGDLHFLFTAPYSPTITTSTASTAIPTFDHSACHAYSASHGLGIRAIAVEVDDAAAAFNISAEHGAKPSLLPVMIDDAACLAEVHLYGDAVLRYISFNEREKFDSSFMPRFEVIEDFPVDFGIKG